MFGLVDFSRFVHFEGQMGIDSGALTTSLFRKYFEQVVAKKILAKEIKSISVSLVDLEQFDLSMNNEYLLDHALLQRR